MVLAYLLKSERSNRRGLYTLALTPSNNHFGAITDLQSWGLIELHPASDQFREVYVVCRELAQDDYHGELRALFGAGFDSLDEMGRQTLNMICIAEKFSREGGLNAKQIYRLIKDRMPGELQKRGEDEFYRAVRYRVEKLAPEKTRQEGQEAAEWITRPDKMLAMRGSANRPVFALNHGYIKPLL